MNNPSPLIPQGSLLEQKNKGRTRVKVAVFVVLAVHGIGLLALLMQGCKKDNDSGAGGAATNVEQTASGTTNAPPAFEPTNAPPVDTNPPAVAGTSAPPPTATPEATVAGTDYKIQAGDTFSSLAHKFHVTTRALLDANPNVQPTKLQIGQTIHIPAPVAATTSNAAPASTDTGTGEVIYTVKSGDTLSSIARDNHVTVRALETANNLKTTSIKVGQKLKIPVKPAAPTSTNTTTPSTTTPPAPGQ